MKQYKNFFSKELRKYQYIFNIRRDSNIAHKKPCLRIMKHSKTKVKISIIHKENIIKFSLKFVTIQVI